MIRERLHAIERVSEAVERDEPVLETGDAHDAAHKLAGSLGSFGLARGSQLARELERRFGPGGNLGNVWEIAQLVAELRAVIER